MIVSRIGRPAYYICNAKGCERETVNIAESEWTTITIANPLGLSLLHYCKQHCVTNTDVQKGVNKRLKKRDNPK